MRNIVKLLALSLLIQISFSCEKNEEIKSNKAELLIIELEINASVFKTVISGTNISLIKDLPFGSSDVKVKTLSISEGATCSISIGDVIHVSDTGIDISITAQNKVTKKVYHLTFSVAVPSDKAELLHLELENNNLSYNTVINETKISLIKDLPYGSSDVKVKTLSISEGATCSISVGDVIHVSDTGIDISITAQNEVTQKVYHLTFSVEAPSNKAELLNLSISYNGMIYQAIINDHIVVVDKEFAYNASGNLTISSFSISENAKANITIGQQFDIDDVILIIILAQDSVTSNTYSLSLNKDTDGELLIEQSSYSNCTKYNTYRFGEMMLENNLWNSDNLPTGSFLQCIYQYLNGTLLLFGWEWSLSEDQHGVNAYPEVIYGLKPWYSLLASTTTNLPKEINEISKLKVSYNIEQYIDDGEYNLAFDNWICSSATSNPESILFEFMIWEDRQSLTAFGDYQGDITTSNGVYKFYKGEPTWEPPGCNWTYLAFVRTERRSSGKVDIDELLDYLVNNGIVPPTSFLSSIELGNEVGNSKGYTVFKSFVVEIE